MNEEHDTPPSLLSPFKNNRNHDIQKRKFFLRGRVRALRPGVNPIKDFY